MYSLCLAMFLVTRPASVHTFIVVPDVLVTCSQSTYVFLVFCDYYRNGARERSRIDCFVLKCVGNVFLVNLCIPDVWQCVSPRAPRAFTHLLCLFQCLDNIFWSKHMYALWLAMILAMRPASVHAFITFFNVWVTSYQWTYVLFVFGNESRHAACERSRIYCYSYCLVMFS